MSLTRPRLSPNGGVAATDNRVVCYVEAIPVSLWRVTAFPFWACSLTDLDYCLSLSSSSHHTSRIPQLPDEDLLLLFYEISYDRFQGRITVLTEVGRLSRSEESR